MNHQTPHQPTSPQPQNSPGKPQDDGAVGAPGPNDDSEGRGEDEGKGQADSERRGRNEIGMVEILENPDTRATTLAPGSVHN